MNEYSISTFGEKFILEINGSRFKYKKSTEQYDEYLTDVLNEKNSFIIFVGSDSGLLLHYLSEKLKPSSNVFCIETIDFISELSNEMLLDNVNLIDYESFVKLVDSKDLELSIFDDTFRLVRSYSVIDGYDVRYLTLYQKVLESITLKKHDFLGSISGLKLFYEANIKNSPDLMNDFLSVSSFFESKNVLILGAGPSLSENIEWIKRNGNRFIIIAVSRVGGILESHNILPDFYITVDPKQVSFDISIGAIQNKSNVPLIANDHANPMLLSNWNGPVFYLGKVLPWDSDLNVKNLRGCGPTVTQTAISIALESKAKSVYLIGVDLCYRINQLQRHSGIKTSIHNFSLDKQYYDVLTNSNCIAKADINLKIAISATASLVKKYPIIPVFNLSSNAASVDGVKYLSLSILEKKTHSILKGRAFVCSKITSADKRLEHLRLLEDDLKSKNAFLKNLVMKAKKNKALIEEYEHIKDDVSLLREKFLEFEFLLKSELGSSFLKFCQVYGMSSFLKLYRDSISDSDDISFDNYINYQKKYNNAWLLVCENLVALLESTLEKVSIRQYEIVGCNFNDVMKYWRDNNEFNRVFLSFIPYPQSCAEVEMNRLIEKYKDHLKVRCEEKKDLEITKRKLLSYLLGLIQTGDCNGIDMLGSLSLEGLFESSSDYEGFRIILDAAKKEINCQRALVYDSYEKILSLDNIDKMLTIYVLERVLKLALKNNDILYINQAFDCLSLLSPKYLKAYGDFLLEISDLQAAVQKYTDYFNMYPDDISILYKIEKSYRDAGFEQQANQIKKGIELYYEK